MSRYCHNDPLSNLILSVRNIPLDDRLSDTALAALSRSYVSMQNLAAVHGPDPSYGERVAFEKALDRLYRICLPRCQADQPFARRSRMTPLLHAMVYLQMRGVDREKSHACYGLMRGLVDEWMRNPALSGDRTPVHGVLRCIGNLYDGVPEAERSREKDFQWYRQQIRDWAAQTDGEGRWAGISPDEALGRIEIMGRNSNLLADTSCDASADRSRRAYCQSILEHLRQPDGKPLRGIGRTLFLLYEVVMWGIGAPDGEWVDAIADAAQRQAARCTYGSDEWLLCQSTVLDRLCMQVGEEIQVRMFADIA